MDNAKQSISYSELISRTQLLNAGDDDIDYDDDDCDDLDEANEKSKFPKEICDSQGDEITCSTLKDIYDYLDRFSRTTKSIRPSAKPHLAPLSDDEELSINPLAAIIELSKMAKACQRSKKKRSKNLLNVHTLTFIESFSHPCAPAIGRERSKYNNGQITLVLAFLKLECNLFATAGIDKGEAGIVPKLPKRWLKLIIDMGKTAKSIRNCEEKKDKESILEMEKAIKRLNYRYVFV